MRDWVSFELVLGILLVTSFTSMGALALWAATSPKHWFIRTAAVIAAIAMPLLIPAYEPLLVFALQTVLIVICVRAWRLWTKQNHHSSTGAIEQSSVPEQGTVFRYSLTTLLLLIPLIAVIAAIVTQVSRHWPRQTVESLSTLILNGVAGACSVLLGAWMFACGRKWIAACAALAALLCLSGVMARFDWLFAWGVHEQTWPPDPQSLSTVFGLLGANETHSELAWFAVLPAITLTTFLLVYLWAHALQPNVALQKAEGGTLARVSKARRAGAACTLGALLVLLAAPPAFILWKLLHPLAIPEFETPQPNGAADILAAGRAFQKSPILSTTVEPQSTEELAAEISKFAASYDRLRLGLSRPVRIHKWPQNDADLLKQLDISLDMMQSFRAASRGLMREAELALQQGRYGDAASISIENLRLGHAITRDGLLVDYLVGIAIEGIAQPTLYESIPNLDARQCRQMIAVLADIERGRESMEDVIHRDRIWSERAFGWTGHFFLLLSDLAESSDSGREVPYGSNRTQAVQQLLALELAIRAFQIEHGELPERLEMLTPEILPQPPVDPFDPSGRPLRYVRTADGYVAYSVGFDGKDNGGAPPPPPHEARAWWDESTPADLRLDNYLAPDPPEDAANGPEGPSAPDGEFR
jgi:hypothetical protein